MEGPLYRLLISSSSVLSKHGCQRKFLFQVGRILKIFPHWNCLAKWTATWWEAPMEGSVLSFLKAEWKVSVTGSVHWASSFICIRYKLSCRQNSHERSDYFIKFNKEYYGKLIHTKPTGAHLYLDYCGHTNRNTNISAFL